MDFYTAQDQARRRSRAFVALFALSIAGVVVLLWLATLAWVSPFHDYSSYLRSLDALAVPDPSPGLFVRIAAQPVASLAILGAWALVLLVPVGWRSLELARSGEVARALGGVQVTHASVDPATRRLLNVVEEMAIASGLPVPQVYVLEDEPSINAFAAGLSPSQASVGITRGALAALDREQLQGVVAHEFSHILNGDMRLNVRLIAWIAGLFGISQLGRVMLRGRSGQSSSGVAVLGLPMLLLGTVGAFVGRLLQAGISRQREWLADASAVQFTRNTDGLRGALVAIARQGAPSPLRAPRADEAAHLFFAQGVRRWLATHPPIDERIRALDRGRRFSREETPGAGRGSGESRGIDPRADRAPGGPTPSGFAGLTGRPASAPHAVSPATSAAAPWADTTPAALAGRVGTVDPGLAALAGDLLRSIPAVVRDAGSPGQATEALLALALSHDEAVRARQLEAVGQRLGGERGGRVRAVFARVRDLEPRMRLPAVQALFPRLRPLSTGERGDLAFLLNRLAHADGRMDAFEFCLARLAHTWLRDGRAARRPRPRLSLGEGRDAVGLLLSVLAWQGAHGQAPSARAAAAAGVAGLPEPRPEPAEPPPDWAPRLWRAFDRLDAMGPHDKREVVAAMAAVILHDGLVHPAESDLLRTACAVLHCPLPLLDRR